MKKNFTINESYLLNLIKKLINRNGYQIYAKTLITEKNNYFPSEKIPIILSSLEKKDLIKISFDDEYSAVIELL